MFLWAFCLHGKSVLRWGQGLGRVKKATGENGYQGGAPKKNGTDMSKNTLSFSDLKISWMDNAFNFVRGSKIDGCKMTKMHVGPKNSVFLQLCSYIIFEIQMSSGTFCQSEAWVWQVLCLRRRGAGEYFNTFKTMALIINSDNYKNNRIHDMKLNDKCVYKDRFSHLYWNLRELKKERKKERQKASKQASKQARKEGRKEERKTGSKEERKKGRKEERKKEKNEGTKKGSKKERKVGRKRMREQW